jgi:hypothetical protein
MSGVEVRLGGVEFYMYAHLTLHLYLSLPHRPFLSTGTYLRPSAAEQPSNIS